MSNENQCTKRNEAKMVAVTKEQGEKLENWCKEFESFFGWKVNVSYTNPTMVVEVIANRFNYRISADGNYLGCILDDKEDRKSCNLTDGYFNFATFAQIMIDILHWESPLRKAEVPMLARPGNAR